MSSRAKKLTLLFSAVYLAGILAVAGWGFYPGYIFGWDLAVYRQAMTSLKAGLDPYAVTIAIQQNFHAHEPHPLGTPVPFSYVYSPGTLPLLRLIGSLHPSVSGTIFWALYIVAAGIPFWVGWQMSHRKERLGLLILSPLLLFFPAFLVRNVALSGNIAYILYGFVLAAAIWGWKRGKWAWFYCAVFVCSCIKEPMLTLLAIPLLSARRQWVPASVCVAASLGVFASQPFLWPTLFQHYLQAVNLQFLYNHDFGASPAGIVTDMLFRTVSYKEMGAVTYGITSLSFLGVMLPLRQRFLSGEIPLCDWAPMVLIVAILLNPRIMEYDIAPITPMLALVLWRVASMVTPRKRIWLVGSLVLAANIVGVWHWWWRPMGCILMVGIYFAGCWMLFRQNTNAASILFPPAEGAIEQAAPVGV